MCHRLETLELAQLPVSEEYIRAELSAASTHQSIRWVIATGRWRPTTHLGSSPFSGATARVILREARRARPYLYASGGWSTLYATAPPPPKGCACRDESPPGWDDWPGMPSSLGAISIKGKGSKWVTERGGATLGHLPTHEVRNPDLYSLAARSTEQKTRTGTSASAMLRRIHTID
jgi:hypothetical protein